MNEKLEKIVAELPGWASLMKLNVLHNLVIETKAKVSVEIGSFAMRGSLAMGAAHKEVGGIHIGIDSYNAKDCVEYPTNPDNEKYWLQEIDFEDVYFKGMQQVLFSGFIKHVNILKLRSDEAFMLLKRIDVIYIDGNPSEEGTCKDVQYYAPLVVEGGYLVLSNTDWESKKKAADLVLQYGFQVEKEYKESCCGMWTVYKKISNNSVSHPELN